MESTREKDLGAGDSIREKEKELEVGALLAVASQ
jgi:hypothetical protein